MLAENTLPAIRGQPFNEGGRSEVILVVVEALVDGLIQLIEQQVGLHTVAVGLTELLHEVLEGELLDLKPHPSQLTAFAVVANPLLQVDVIEVGDRRG